jgi:hypothetical protein
VKALLSAVLVLVVTAPCLGADRYVGATVDEAGRLRILTSAGRAIVLPSEPDQVGIEAIAVAPDGRSVGWLALYANCCTSYPIPLKLLVYVRGALREFTGVGLPVWHWRYAARGAQVAFSQETVHGGLGIHYELRDVLSGRLVAEYTPAIGPDGRPLPNQTVPAWVTELDAKQDASRP